ncbi:hypothetical protein [Amycolatopsis sacchari]|uniref:hypothetical protein n=1 Tax=Amycolatopsis sacchari TaxID=115433 RepID=UPI003D736445
MPLTWIIPTSLLYLGAVFLVLAIVLVFVDVPGKGVPWDKVGAWFAVIGGFGVGGAAGGWLGRAFSSTSDSVLTNGQRFTAQAVGVGVVGAIVLGLALWAYSRVRGKGIGTKTKFKSLLVVFVLAVVGTVLSAIPEIYGWADGAVNWAGNAVIAAIR